MNKIKKIVRETIIDYFNEFTNPFHIIVILDKNDLNKIDYLNEGKWVPSGENGYMKRLDRPNFDFEKLHVHIARDKHINTKNKQVSWNDDGTKHDKKSFNNNFNGIETARSIAKKALGLSDDFQLENLNELSKGQLLLENVESIPETTSVFIFKVCKIKTLND